MKTECCPHQKWLSILGCSLLLSGFFVGGYWLGGSSTTRLSSSSEISRADSPMKLLADTAARGESVSIATGQINPELEGLFILDHVTGNLFCMMINPRTGVEIGTYKGNVKQTMGLGRQGDTEFVLATGFINLNEGGRTGNQRAANCLCYVVEGKSGKAVGYGLTFNQTGLQKNLVQQGDLVPIWQGAFRTAAIVPNPVPGQPGDENAADAAAAAGNAGGGN